MQRWAVAFTTLYDNDTIIEIVYAPTWEDAILNHSAIGDEKVELIQPTLDETKVKFFDGDCLIDVKAIP